MRRGLSWSSVGVPERRAAWPRAAGRPRRSGGSGRPTRWLLLAVGLAALGPWGCSANAAAAPSSRVEEQLDFGVEMARRGLWSEALFRFQQADRARPNDVRILNNIAVAYEAVGLFEQALEGYKRALKVDPSNRDLRNNYSRFVEFYQGFRPEVAQEAAPTEGQGEAQGEGQGAAAAEAPAPTAEAADDG